MDKDGTLLVVQRGRNGSAVELGDRPIRGVPHPRQGDRRGGVSPDGKQVASASSDKLVLLSDASLKPELKVRQRWEHSAPVTSIAFSPDGKSLFATTWDGVYSRWTLGETPVTANRHSGADIPFSWPRPGRQVSGVGRWRGSDPSFRRCHRRRNFRAWSDIRERFFLLCFLHPANCLPRGVRMGRCYFGTLTAASNWRHSQGMNRGSLAFHFRRTAACWPAEGPTRPSSSGTWKSGSKSPNP